MTSLVIHVKNENVSKSSAQQLFPKKITAKGRESSIRGPVHLDNGEQAPKAFQEFFRLSLFYHGLIILGPCWWKSLASQGCSALCTLA